MITFTPEGKNDIIIEITQRYHVRRRTARSIVDTNLEGIIEAINTSNGIDWRGGNLPLVIFHENKEYHCTVKQEQLRRTG